VYVVAVEALLSTMVVQVESFSERWILYPVISCPPVELTVPQVSVMSLLETEPAKELGAVGRTS
jgi:hypothetical protein